MNEQVGSENGYVAERRRSATYRLLGELYHEPDEKQLERLAAAHPGAVGIDTERLVDAAGDVQSLRLDRARLFVGPFELAAPPYESVYVDSGDRVMTESTETVRAEYRRAGVDVDLDEPADHVAAELEFVSLLVATELEAIEAKEFEAAEHYLERQYEFLSAHLGRWISELADDVREHADTGFYRALADETRRFVEADGHLLSDRLDRLETTDDDVLDVLDALKAPGTVDEYESGTTGGGENR